MTPIGYFLLQTSLEKKEILKKETIRSVCMYLHRTHMGAQFHRVFVQTSLHIPYYRRIDYTKHIYATQNSNYRKDFVENYLCEYA